MVSIRHHAWDRGHINMVQEMTEWQGQFLNARWPFSSAGSPERTVFVYLSQMDFSGFSQESNDFSL